MSQACQPKEVNSVICDENGEPQEFEVVKIHAKQWFPKKRRYYYRVEWVGYTELTYEPVENFAGLEEEKEFLEREAGKRRQPKRACQDKSPFIEPEEKEEEGMEEELPAPKRAKKGLASETPRTTGSCISYGEVIANEKALKSLECLEGMDEPRFEKEGEVEVIALVYCGDKETELGAFVQYADGEFKCFPLDVVEERFPTALLRHQRQHIGPTTTVVEGKTRARG